MRSSRAFKVKIDNLLKGIAPPNATVEGAFTSFADEGQRIIYVTHRDNLEDVIRIRFDGETDDYANVIN